MKKVAMLIIFVFCITCLCFAGQEYTGTITKISGQYCTIRDDNGNVTTVKRPDRIILQIGDRVNVSNGMIIGDSGKPSHSPRLNPQPEPPLLPRELPQR
jgi:hypothetical protein